MAELTCQQLVELVTEYLEDTLTAKARADFEAHLEECPACADYVAQFRHTIGALGALADAAPAQPSAELLELFRSWRDHHVPWGGCGFAATSSRKDYPRRIFLKRALWWSCSLIVILTGIL